MLVTCGVFVSTQALQGAAQMKQMEGGQMKEMEEVRALYQKEALQRKILYNQVRTHGEHHLILVVNLFTLFLV